MRATRALSVSSPPLGAENADGLTGFVVDVIDRIGEVGVGVLIAAENIFPPIPSEAILPFAGFSASTGEINAVAAWVAATIGALVGAYVLYGVGALIGYDRLQVLARKRWFFLFGESDLARGERFFERHGTAIVLVGRFIPLVRSIVSVPAGWSRMPLARFTLLTAIGAGIWNAVFIAIGYQLGERWDRVEGWIEPIGYAVLAVIAGYLVWLASRKLRGATR
jgi:membrane protein DedA with SNARE-associated domain